jgi:hypothetical protein
MLKRNGVYIEAGANEGEFWSNTLLLETDFGWKGILVEPSPITQVLLLKKNRKAIIVDGCLSTEPHYLKVFDTGRTKLKSCLVPTYEYELRIPMH